MTGLLYHLYQATKNILTPGPAPCSPTAPGAVGSGGRGLQGGALCFWAEGALSSLTVRLSPCKGTEATSEGWGCASPIRLGPLWYETVSPLSYWALLGGRNHSPFSLFLPQKNREVGTQCGCGSLGVRAGPLWGCAPAQGFRVPGALAARGLPCEV